MRPVDYNPFEPVYVWYVVFQDRADFAPWYIKPFLSDGFRHVYAMRQLTGDSTLIVNNIAYGLLVDTCGYPVEACAVSEHERGSQVVQIATKLQARYTLRVMSCVSVVKALLGIHDRSIWTPRQLYEYLIYNGGQDLCEAWEDRSEAVA